MNQALKSIKTCFFFIWGKNMFSWRQKKKKNRFRRNKQLFGRRRRHFFSSPRLKGFKFWVTPTSMTCQKISLSFSCCCCRLQHWRCLPPVKTASGLIVNVCSFWLRSPLPFSQFKLNQLNSHKSCPIFKLFFIFWPMAAAPAIENTN